MPYANGAGGALLERDESSASRALAEPRDPEPISDGSALQLRVRTLEIDPLDQTHHAGDTRQTRQGGEVVETM